MTVFPPGEVVEAQPLVHLGREDGGGGGRQHLDRGVEAQVVVAVVDPQGLLHHPARVHVAGAHVVPGEGEEGGRDREEGVGVELEVGVGPLLLQDLLQVPLRQAELVLGLLQGLLVEVRLLLEGQPGEVDPDLEVLGPGPRPPAPRRRSTRERASPILRRRASSLARRMPGSAPCSGRCRAGPAPSRRVRLTAPRSRRAWKSLPSRPSRS